ncbi:LysR substrate-binding domain-containing protein [Microvirga sp. 17 mud 1-3]|uniref:LysR substrate-binding domain-containing protein n=1 Tax=Microvirga sp. 17 mud 1-3 TaxID=2082949 RepID=UPI000D6D310F|nr:LysR substrate-binding domain-containing protein [Microvirga sp. 17 mud 1-3]AWM85964.1 LysR family transcriptional regulator [Microvirga sp. 17 mud 1-3]
MARNLDISLLRAFVAVADTGGMTAASGVLNLTQAAVSQQIKRLEEQIGEELFARDRRGMKLTGAGERLFGRAKRLLALNDEIWTEMTTPEYEGQVRLGIPSDIITTYLPTFLKNFARSYPRVQISLQSGSSARLRSELQAGRVDVVLATELSCDPEGENLVMDRLVWVGARGGEAARQRPLPVSIGCSDCAFRAPIREALQQVGIEWRSTSEVTNTSAQVATVAADIAVMAWMASTVPEGLEVLGRDSGLPPLPPFTVNLYLPRDGGDHIVQELARHIRDAVAGPRRMVA